MNCRIAKRLNHVRNVPLALAGMAAALVLVTTALPTRAIAQPQDQPQIAVPTQPAFEVASVKMNNSNERRNVEFSPNTLTILNMPLLNIIIQAYGLPPWQMSFGSFDSVLQQRYDIVAKVANRVSKEQMRLMLQTLLGDRFHLKVHHEQKLTQVYALVVDKGEQRFHAATPDEEADIAKDLGPDVRVQTVKCTNTTMQMLASTLMELAASKTDPSRIVVDKTGIKGGFDFALEWMRDDGTADNSAPPDRLPLIIGALHKIGLTLKTDRAPVDNLVVDHIEKIPTEN